jgi:hypothetical protein
VTDEVGLLPKNKKRQSKSWPSFINRNISDKMVWDVVISEKKEVILNRNVLLS